MVPKELAKKGQKPKPMAAKGKDSKASPRGRAKVEGRKIHKQQHHSNKQ